MRGTCPGHISCQATLVSFLSVFVLFSFNFVKPACYWDPLPLRALSKLESKVCGWFGTRQTQGSRPIISLTSLNWAQMPWESCFSRWKLGKLFQELHPGACWLALGLVLPITTLRGLASGGCWVLLWWATWWLASPPGQEKLLRLLKHITKTQFTHKPNWWGWWC